MVQEWSYDIFCTPVHAAAAWYYMTHDNLKITAAADGKLEKLNKTHKTHIEIHPKS